VSVSGSGSVVTLIPSEVTTRTVSRAAAWEGIDVSSPCQVWPVERTRLTELEVEPSAARQVAVAEETGAPLEVAVTRTPNVATQVLGSVSDQAIDTTGMAMDEADGAGVVARGRRWLARGVDRG
jgi:hypothetical protein